LCFSVNRTDTTLSLQQETIQDNLKNLANLHSRVKLLEGRGELLYMMHLLFSSLALQNTFAADEIFGEHKSKSYHFCYF